MSAILRGLDTETILKDLRTAFPTDKTAAGTETVRWYRSHVRRVQAGKPPRLPAGAREPDSTGRGGGVWYGSRLRKPFNRILRSKPLSSYIGLIEKERTVISQSIFPIFGLRQRWHDDRGGAPNGWRL